jgi:hypothetical protein
MQEITLNTASFLSVTETTPDDWELNGARSVSVYEDGSIMACDVVVEGGRTSVRRRPMHGDTPRADLFEALRAHGETGALGPRYLRAAPV